MTTPVALAMVGKGLTEAIARLKALSVGASGGATITPALLRDVFFYA